MANEDKKQAKDMYKTRKAYKPENESGLEKDVEQPFKRTFYERIENPDYGPTKRSSLAVSAMGGLLLAAGLATEMYPLAYIGATLGFGSLGYYSGHRRRAKQLDQWYTKVEGLEEKILEPYENKTLYEDKYVSQKEVDELWKKQHPWDWRLFGVNFALRMSNKEPLRLSRYGLLYAGYLQFAALIGVTLLGIGLGGPQLNPAYILPGLSMAAAGFASRFGFTQSKKSAKPEYREVRGLKEKLKELPPRKKADKPPKGVIQW